MIAACQQTGPITVAPNLAPLVRIVAPEIPDGADAVTVALGQGVTVQAVAQDAEDGPADLSLSWSAQRTDTVADPVPLGESTPGADGYVDFVVGGLAAGAWRVTATVTDTDGASSSAALPIVVLAPDAPPEVTITQPEAGATFLEGALITFSAVAGDDRGAASLDAEWLSSLDGVIGGGAPSSTGLLITSTDGLHVGLHVITVRVVDEEGQAAEDTVSIEVISGNEPPSQPVVAISPAAPITTDDLVCSLLVGSSDPEAQPITYTFAWSVGGVPAGVDTPTLPAAQTSRGQAWTCSVTASDGVLASAPGTASVTIGNAAPGSTAAVLGPTPAYETTVLGCTGQGFIDADGDAPDYQVAWTVNGAPAGATPTLDGAAFSRGDVVACTASAWDGQAAGPPRAASPVTISNSAPTAPAIAISPAQPELTDPLACAVVTAATDADGDAITDEVQWWIDGVHDPAWDGHWTIPAGEAALGESWVCRARGADDADAGPWAEATAGFAPSPGDLVITEFLADPGAVSDAAGEWVEIANTRDHDLDLFGFELHDDGTDSFTFLTEVRVPAHGRVVVARNADAASNGGVVADAEWSGFVLDDAGDEIVLSFDGVEIDRVEYGATWSGGRQGSAWALDPDLGDPDAASNDAAASWCRSSVPFGLDFGTPGAENDRCPCGLSDGDLDGWGDDGSCGTLDCDDNDPGIRPDAVDVCEDAVDQDCTGADALCACAATDDDGDGVGDGATCAPVDCDDADPTRYPGAAEVCDGADQDCDPQIDEGFDGDGDGYTTCGGDCADADDTRYPGAVEVCDGVDQDCDGAADDGLDLDGDGYTPCGGDCGEGDGSRYPGAPESCDGDDSNCNGSLVDGFPNFDADALPDCVDPDDDNDGDPDTADCADFDGAIFHGASESCDLVDSDCDGSLVDSFPNFDGDSLPDCQDPDDDNDGEVDASDCNDANASIYTGAPESCDAVDSNCNGSLVDSFANFDGDTEPDCIDANDDNDPSPDNTDCDDNNASIYVGAPESCDSVDSDCDGSLVDSFPNFDGDSEPDCVDANDDNDPSPDNADCDDFNQNIYPGAVEICNGINDDCDAQVDEGFDTDGDGVTSCGGDCAPSNGSIYPGANDTCNGIDNDCDNVVDENAAGDAWEPNNSRAQSAYLAGDDTDVTLYPSFHYSTDVSDWFSINTADDTDTICDAFRIRVWMASIPSGTDYDIYLYNASGGLLAYSEQWGTTDEAIDWSPGCLAWEDNGGTYYIEARRYSGYSCSDTYQLRVRNES